ncbi:MAG: flagellar basal-body MS-ring/collar protein FliF, partial [Gammaproteobacteria bacterium]
MHFMVFLNNLGEQLKDLWKQSSKSGRIGFIAIGLLCVAAIAGVGIWSSRPHYVPVASNLGPAEAAEIVSKLDADGILNQLNFSGSAVLVPKTQWNRARLLLGDLVGPMRSGADDFDDSLLSDPSLNHFRMLRHQEETLARTIARLNSVVNATVHIGQPQPSPFVQERKATTASVILELRPGVIFTREQAAAVVSMVANSVTGLDPQAVSVVDTKGRMLSSHTSAADTEVTSRLEYQRKLESDLASKAEVMLREMLGTGRAVVRVTADLDFTQIKREEITYDPESKVKKTERIKTMSRTGIAKAALGVAGTASNVGNATSTRQKAPFTETEEENEVEYENAMIRDTVTEAPGAIKRLTVAAVVDLSPPDDQQAESAAAPITKEQ